MDLRSMKKEVHGLPDVKAHLKAFEKAFIKPIKANSNKQLPSLQNMPSHTKALLNGKLANAKTVLKALERHGNVPARMHSHSRHLVSLALADMRGNEKQAKTITSSLLNDDVLSLQQTITHVKAFDEHVKLLEHHYNQINDLVHEHLTLEEQLAYMDAPHKKYLHSLVKTSTKQKKIVRHIGRNLVKLAKRPKLKEAKLHR